MLAETRLSWTLLLMITVGCPLQLQSETEIGGFGVEGIRFWVEDLGFRESLGMSPQTLRPVPSGTAIIPNTPKQWKASSPRTALISEQD